LNDDVLILTKLMPPGIICTVHATNKNEYKTITAVFSPRTRAWQIQNRSHVVMRRELVVSSRTKKRTVELDNNERRKKKTFLLAREARTSLCIWFFQQKHSTSVFDWSNKVNKRLDTGQFNGNCSKCPIQQWLCRFGQQDPPAPEPRSHFLQTNVKTSCLTSGRTSHLLVVTKDCQGIMSRITDTHRTYIHGQEAFAISPRLKRNENQLKYRSHT
jgi:hypothetical protein